MYSLIAGEYDRLFPHPRAKTDFVEKLLPEGAADILDLGCATGELLLSLGKGGRKLTGIDLDNEMILQAIGKAAERNMAGEVNFLHFEMASYLAYNEKFSYDMILCFGNTLAYLEGMEALNSFMAHTYGQLRPMGQLVIQILNYDNPSMGKDFQFIDLHTDRVNFSRFYTAGPRQNLLFNTELTDLATGEKSSDIHTLYPFKRADIRRLASETGFRQFQAYGGYDFRKAQDTDQFRLYVMRK